jgi:tetratricopeptide (TPR) repeat protein
VKLLDFGIAKMLDGAAIGAGAVLTEYGNVALTPRYAAPEQVTGKPISTLTDVFVLGVLLHELLTGKLPYAHAVGDAPSLAQMVAALTRGESSRPSAAPLTDEAATLRALPTASRLAATLRGDLDTIVKKALSPDPAARYGSAGEMANDIRSFLARKPIAARPASRWYATRLLLLRHRAVGIAAGLGLMAVLGAGAVAWRNHLDSRMYEERGIAVRDFMRDLVNDSEPSETQPDAPVTFNDMIDSSVRRARVDYSTQPVLQGELLSELGRMYWVLGRSDASLPVLAEAVDLLERNTTDDDPALNKARTYLASELLERNETGRAKDLASRALEFCRRDNRDCARARANANSLLSRLAFIDGQTESALALHRRALEETRRAYGTRHSETVLAMQALATALRNSGHLTEASALIVQATDLAGSITLKKIDRTILLRTAALLDMDLGRYQAAERRLTKLIGTTTAREERALLLRLLANTALALGEPARALDAANEAIALALTDQIDIEGLFAKQSRAQARSLLESYPEAFADIDAVLAGLRAVGYAEHSYELLRARRIRAEVQLRAGEIVPAARELEGLLKRHEALGVPVSSEWGLALDLFGCTQRELGESTEAGAIHRRAATQLEKQLPADHPFRLRNTLYQLAAAEERGEFERLARSLQGGLPPNSLWLQLVDVRRGNRSCRDVGRKSCVFVL